MENEIKTQIEKAEITKTLIQREVYENNYENLNRYDYLRDFSYSWRTLTELSFVYEGDYKDKTRVYLDFVNLIVIEFKKLETEFTIEMFKLNNHEDLKNYICQYPLSEYDRSLNRLKVYLESLKGKSGKNIIQNNVTIKEDDILYSSWGYDQTNVEFYKVLRVLSDHYMIVQEVGRKYEDRGFMCGDVTPSLSFVEGSIPKKVNVNKKGYIKLCNNSGSSGMLWIDTGKSHYTSSYA